MITYTSKSIVFLLFLFVGCILLSLVTFPFPLPLPQRTIYYQNKELIISGLKDFSGLSLLSVLINCGLPLFIPFP